MPHDIDPNAEYHAMTEAYREGQWNRVIVISRPLWLHLCGGGRPFDGYGLSAARDFVAALRYDAMLRQTLEDYDRRKGDAA